MRFRKNRGAYKIAFAGLMLILASMACDVDQNYPPLFVGASPTKFDPWVYENHDWPADVVPGTKYEVILTLGNIDGVYNGGSSTLQVLPAKTCSDCVTFVETYDSPMKISFIGPDDGHVLILFIPGLRYTTSTIQLREIGKTATDPLADVRTYLRHLDICQGALALILSVFGIISMRKSHIFNYKFGKAWNEQPVPRINFIWLAILIFLLTILVSIFRP